MPLDWENIVAPKLVAPREKQTYPGHDAWGHKPAVQMSDDLRRVLELPRRELELDGTERAETIIDSTTARYARPIHKNCKCATIQPQRHADEGCITRLRLVQALALREIGICGGLLGPIGVGHGKTLIDVLAPLAFQHVGVQVSVLLIPVKLCAQLIEDYEYIGQHFKMPQIVFHGNPYQNTCQKMNVNVPLERGAPLVHVVPYSRISLHEATVWLEERLKPQAIIADECHKLRDIVNTATGSRVDRYMRAHPECRFAGWSGSIMSKRLTDFDHLAMWALRGASPMPLKKETTEEWGSAIEVSDNPAEPGPLMKLCKPGEHLMSGFRRRLVETLGVVCTSAPAVDCELSLEEHPAPAIPEKVRHALKMVRGELPGQSGPQRPDGEELADALAIARTAREVACGFYNIWIFPQCEFPRDTELVETWRLRRAMWFREVRQKLKGREEHLDSVLLVERAARRHHGDMPKVRGLPTWNSEHWCAWRDIENKVVHKTKPILLDDYLIKNVAEWGLKNRGVIWYEHSAFGRWVSEYSGLPRFGAGKDAKTALLGDPSRGIVGEDGSRSVICSLKAFGTGTNGMQFRWDTAFFPNPMSASDGWEQSLGRLHRMGQKSPIVRNYFLRHTPELRSMVDAALTAAMSVEGALGSQQKLRLGFKL